MIAYSSTESGRNEIYVQPFPALDTRTQVATDGGAEAVWSRDGSKLYFRRGRGLWVSDVRISPVFSASRPTLLLEADMANSPAGMASYDVAPDGERFVIFRAPSAENQVEVKVVLNWIEELRRMEASGS